MVTRSNSFPLPDVKTPSLVTFSRTGPRTLQGPHQLSGDMVNVASDFLHAKRRVLCIKVGYYDFVFDLKCLFETLVMMGDGYQSRGCIQDVYSARTFWSTFGKRSCLLIEDEKARMNGRDGDRRKEMLSIFRGRVLPSQQP